MLQIHKSALVESDSIGKNTKVWQNCVILKGAKIGCGCNINYNVFIENDVFLGDNVTVKSGVQIWDGIYIEDEVFIGPNVTFTNDVYPRSKQKPSHFFKTIIKKGCSLGANSTIVSGCKIGQYSMIGAGSVVTKDIPPFTIWFGNPARQKGYITKMGEPIGLNLVGKFNKKKYTLINSEPKL